MIPYLIVGAALGAALIKLFSSNESNNSELKGITNDTIYQAGSQTCKDDTNIPLLKGRITQLINRIEKKYENFKIGKTGDPDTRDNSHKAYKYMFILCSSDKAHHIENLESYFTTKYKSNIKCDNKKGGSAGTIKSVDGMYYLYMVVGEEIAISAKNIETKKRTSKRKAKSKKK